MIYMRERPWGYFGVLDERDGYWVKRLVVAPGQRISLQKHKYRSEIWICVRGKGIALVKDFPKTLKEGTKTFLSPGVRVEVPVGAIHRLTNDSRFENLEVIEIALGDPYEDDIERIEDDYFRIPPEEDE